MQKRAQFARANETKGFFQYLLLVGTILAIIQICYCYLLSLLNIIEDVNPQFLCIFIPCVFAHYGGKNGRCGTIAEKCHPFLRISLTGVHWS